MTGWIKLHRCSFEKDWLKNHNMWVFWTYCLLKANHKKGIIVFNGKEVELNPGQFIFGINKACEEINLTPQKIRTVLKKLKKMENITIKSTNKYSIISITNWEIYQSDEEESNNQTNKQITFKQHSNNIQITTNKNVKNVKNEKNEKKKTEIFHDKNIESFKKLFDTFGHGNEKSAFNAFCEKQDVIMKNFKMVLQAAEIECKTRPAEEEQRKYKKQLTNWILNECWNDTVYKKNKIQKTGKFELTDAKGNKLDLKNKNSKKKDEKITKSKEIYNNFSETEKERFYSFAKSRENSTFFRLNEFIISKHIDYFIKKTEEVK